MSTTTAAGLDRETLDLIIDSIGGFADEHLPESLRLELDEQDRFPEDLVRGMCGGELGIQLLFIPEEYEGMGGGAFDVYRVCEALARIDLGVATGVLATFLGSDPIHFGGTPEQKRLWMTRVAEEGLLMAYAATEPEAPALSDGEVDDAVVAAEDTAGLVDDARLVAGDRGAGAGWTRIVEPVGDEDVQQFG